MLKFREVINFLFSLYLKEVAPPEPYPVDANEDIIFGEVLLSQTIKGEAFKQNASKKNLSDIFFSVLRENNNLKDFTQKQPKEKIFFILWSRYK
ncbi:MAG: hypothetical protein K9M44_03515 [Candidatus Pacebacteria bacterium]|nr:hypothetical protein [Candidatus Paceibacterota bacterium]